MEDSNAKPDVVAIVQELRRGMADAEPLQPTDPRTIASRGLNTSLRKATETGDVLGRCGGSLRGKLCSRLAFWALPVIEQLNIHHGAVIAALNHIRDAETERAAEEKLRKVEPLEARIRKLEDDIASLKAEISS
jgi:hypothetical protein